MGDLTQSLIQSNVEYAGLVGKILADLAAGRSIAITGLSNSGKSTLMRTLASKPVVQAYESKRGRPANLLYIDCNRAVALSAQAFYEVVLRSLIERLEDELPEELEVMLRQHHESVTQADQSFGASLSFNLALTELCESLGRDLVLLLDEFDEIYASLEERALVNLRALGDRFSDRLHYVVATVRDLSHLRGRTVEGEFAEMFSRSTYPMPLLDQAQSTRLLERFDDVQLTPAQWETCHELAGGHPGLLLATALSIGRAEAESDGSMVKRILGTAQPSAECMKIWSQLTEAEQSYLGSLVLQPEAGVPGPHLSRLRRLSLVGESGLFSPVFERFVQRRMRAPEVSELGIHVDEDSGDVWVDGVRIPVLTDLEFRLMQLLDDRRDKLTDKYEIVTGVWGEDYLGEVDDARVEKLISRLRGKIEPDPSDPRYLITQRGRGYKLLSQPQPAA